MIWEKIRGHQDQVTKFRRSAQRGRLSHAYLFAGPDGIGKKMFARTLGQCLLCERFSAADLAACGECSGCRQVMAGTHPDLFLVGCPEGKSELPIEVFVGSRERRGKEGLCYELSLRPMAGGRKVAIIDDANLMNAASANALLKTLEEPPAQSVMILIATNADALLPTIRSRCQQIRFAPLPENDIAELLVEQQLVNDPAEVGTVAGLSEGSLAVAGQLVEPALRDLRQMLYDSLAAEGFDSLALAEKTIEGLEELGGDNVTQRRNAVWLVRFCLEFYRLASRQLAGAPTASSVAQVDRFVSRLDPAVPEDLELSMQLFERTALAETQLARRTAIPLCLQALFDDLGRICRSAVRA